jgi:hypothetical protein
MIACARNPVSLIKGAALLIATLIWLSASPAPGIILYRTGDPGANTTEPTGALADSGWQYEGTFGNYLGTAIAPHFFITAQHIGFESDKFHFRGADYTIVGSFDDPSTDLRVFQVAETLPAFAPLYAGNAEVGKHLVVIGRGKQRGTELRVNGSLRGWQWGVSDLVQRWGENQVAAIKQVAPAGDMIYALFDANGLPNEAHLANGDSGGGVFVDDGGVWKLAGINYDVDGPTYTGPEGTGAFYAAIFDQRGFYGRDGKSIGGGTPVPTGFFASRISPRVGWIDSVIEPRLVNISARAAVGDGDQVAIAGFIINGDSGQSQRVALRGLGPSLQANGGSVPGRLSDPTLELHDATGAIVTTNDNWRNGAQAAEIQKAGLGPTDDREAALMVTLSSGSYSVILRDAAGGTGIGLIEVYDADAVGNARLLNLSTRARVAPGDNAIIGGFIVHTSSQRLLLRAIGPDLAAYGVTGPLSNPTLELHDGNGAILIANDDWRAASNQAEVTATGLAPGDARDSAILFTPRPGAYTAIVRGAETNSAGVALLECYVVD